ncbi:chemotaxis protein CheW [Ancylothrix sp. C2]|uniref:chemotaxis protein CheW n=1 Tax=Ancylothrix sp. D3o TaxID=2953691 RepID=UPI0021BAE1A7|nr:chemotaxis protein CheW [Ancylothrix sp. D3o]MCT7949184.1 chemotaxis protein CheW [Ancylothrix sp. D3o]
MLKHEPYLIFSLNDSSYGVEAVYVREVFFLPELIPIPEAIRDVVGVVNVRGEILPMIDLEMRFGQRAGEYKITDSVVVMEWGGYKAGIIVNQVYEVVELEAEQVTNEVFKGRKLSINTHNFIDRIAKIDDRIVMLINHKNIIDFYEKVDLPTADQIATSPNYEEIEKFVPHFRKFCPNATPEERTIFKERAASLMQQTDRQDFTGLIAVAVISLNEEFFAVDLELVREFTDLRKITPVPCTPPHIIGNMNLRGEIVTIVDIRGLLNLPRGRINKTSKAMIVHQDDVVAAIPVENVFDVIYLHPSQLMQIPVAIHSNNDEYLRGTAPYRDKIMMFLDLGKILSKGELVVNEEV